jgi:prevent-host-death family protein
VIISYINVFFIKFLKNYEKAWRISPNIIFYKYWRNSMAINLKNDIKPISYIKTNAAEMMKYVNERKNPIVITQNGEARAVLVDIETYQETQDAFALMSLIKIAEKDIQNGNVEPAKKVFSELKKEIAEND